jgi:hypothetical protein
MLRFARHGEDCTPGTKGIAIYPADFGLLPVKQLELLPYGLPSGMKQNLLDDGDDIAASDPVVS